MNTLSANARKFADACFENSIEELRAALAQEEADTSDCAEWDISPEEWSEAIKTAIREKGE